MTHSMLLDGLSCLAPALLVALPLLFGHYLGEDRIERFRAMRRPRRLVGRRATPSRRAPRACVRRGRLIASLLAGRGPPRLT